LLLRKGFLAGLVASLTLPRETVETIES
jgi:hypothetical protein